jgi:hypothetical protein
LKPRARASRNSSSTLRAGGDRRRRRRIRKPQALDEQQAPSWVDRLLAVPQNDEASNRLEVALRDITP